MQPKVNILFIEDERNILTFVRKLLYGHNYKVTTAITGTEGLQLINSICPDLILLTGEPDSIAAAKEEISAHFHGYIDVYCSDPFFLEIVPKNVDKAASLLKLLTSIGLTADEMICCGDGYNDLTMIETAGLGVAMENAQPLVREKADFITKSNDDDGVLYVIDQFMRD